ncbi:MAG: hypothetical protein WCO60_14355 [Verrucomicrobiota bacterium]
MAVTETQANRKDTDLSLPQLAEKSKAIANARKIALEAVQGLGLFSAVIDEHPKPRDPVHPIGSWCSIYGMKNNLWLDILIEAELEGAEAVFRELTGSPTSAASDAYDLLGEIANFVRGGIRKVMSSEGEESLVFGTPKEVPGGNLHSAFHYPCTKIQTYFKADDFRLTTTFLIHHQMPVSKTLGKLRPLDISLEAIPTSLGSTLEVLAKGVPLSLAWIEKLRARYMKETKERQILVLTPPIVTQLFHPKF